MSTQRRFLYHDADLCMGCHSCEVACKMEHDLPAGVNRVRIVTEGPTIVDGELKLSFKRIYCHQCPQSPCLEVCPTGAIKTRPDGIIFIDQSQCTGCRVCADVCPYDAISFHPYKLWAEICDSCFNRLDEGLPPFCIQYCMSGALFFGTEEEFQQRKQKMAVRGGKGK